MTDEQIDEAWEFSTGGRIVSEDMRAFARRIAQEAARQEREACAKLCEAQISAWEYGEGVAFDSALESCAAAIRARSDR